MTTRRVTFLSIKLTDTQIALLSAAAQRGDRCLDAPPNLKGGAARKVAAKLIDAGLAKEIKAKPRAPVWRQDERAEQSYALKLTAAGLRAIAADNRPASDEPKNASSESVGVAAAGSETIRQATAVFRQRTARDCPRPEAARSWR